MTSNNEPTTTEGQPISATLVDGLCQDQKYNNSFNQKSQSLRRQMQLVHDKLFETDKMSLSMQNLHRNSQNTSQYIRNLRASSEVPLRSSTNNEESKENTDQNILREVSTAKMSPQRCIKSKSSSPMRLSSTALQKRRISPCKINQENFNPSTSPQQNRRGAPPGHGGGDTLLRLDRAVIQSHNSNLSIGSNNCTQKASAFKNITNYNVQLKNPSDEKQKRDISDLTLTDELNQSCSQKQIVKMSLSTLGKYVNHQSNHSPHGSGFTTGPRNAQHVAPVRGYGAIGQDQRFETGERTEPEYKMSSQYGAMKAKEVLQNMMLDETPTRSARQAEVNYRMESDQAFKNQNQYHQAQPNFEDVKLQLQVKTSQNPLQTSMNAPPIHMIPENSLEVSNSKQDSNHLEETRQLDSLRDVDDVSYEQIAPCQQIQLMADQMGKMYNMKEFTSRSNVTTSKAASQLTKNFGASSNATISNTQQRQRNGQDQMGTQLDLLDSRARTLHPQNQLHNESQMTYQSQYQTEQACQYLKTEGSAEGNQRSGNENTQNSRNHQNQCSEKYDSLRPTLNRQHTQTKRFLPPSSLITTNNNSRKSMLVDYKKMEQQCDSSEGHTIGLNNVSSNRSENKNPNSIQFNIQQTKAMNFINGQQQTGQEHYEHENNYLMNIHQQKQSQEQMAEQEHQQRMLIRDISSKSNFTNLTNNGKSEPICSDMETQRQTVISNLQQFNQERLNELNLLNQISHDPQLQEKAEEDQSNSDDQSSAPRRLTNDQMYHYQARGAMEQDLRTKFDQMQKIDFMNQEQQNQVIINSYQDLLNMKNIDLMKEQNIQFKIKSKKKKHGLVTHQQSPTIEDELNEPHWNKQQSSLQNVASQNIYLDANDASQQHLAPQSQMQLSNNRNVAASHSFLLQNDQELQNNFKITKSPSFITSQDHYNSLNHGLWRPPLHQDNSLNTSHLPRRHSSMEAAMVESQSRRPCRYEPGQSFKNCQSLRNSCSFSNKRQSYSVFEKNKSSQLLICKNQLTNQEKLNHVRIKDQILAKHYRNLSQQSIQIDNEIVEAEENLIMLKRKRESRSAATTSNAKQRWTWTACQTDGMKQHEHGLAQHQDQEDQGPNNNFHNHLSSIQNFDVGTYQENQNQQQIGQIQNQNPMYVNNSNSSLSRGLNIKVHKTQRDGQNQGRSFSANDKDQAHPVSKHSNSKLMQKLQGEEGQPIESFDQQHLANNSFAQGYIRDVQENYVDPDLRTEDQQRDQRLRANQEAMSRSTEAVQFQNQQEQLEALQQSIIIKSQQELPEDVQGQSTNTWSQLIPKNLPEQIHQNNNSKGDGWYNGDGVMASVGQTDSFQQHQQQQLTHENLKKLLITQEEEEYGHGTNNSYHTQNLHNQSVLKQLQQSNLISTQAKASQMMDNKNLRNFFIQSSLTFNGNNVNSNSNKTHSALGSISLYEGVHTHQTHGSAEDSKKLGTNQNWQKRQQVNEQEQRAETAEHEQQMHENESQPIQQSDYDQIMQDMMQQEVNRSHANINEYQSQNYGQYLQQNSLNGVNMKQFQTHQQNTINDRQILQMINEEGTSGFFSGNELGGLQMALGGLDQQTSSNIFTSNDNSNANTKDNSRVASQQNLMHIQNMPTLGSLDNLQPKQLHMSQDSICAYSSNPTGKQCAEKNISQQNNMSSDLPSALNYIQHLTAMLNEAKVREQEMQANGRINSEEYEHIQQELLEVENQKLHIEQEMLELVEQRKIINGQNESLQQNLEYRTNQYNELVQQNRELQESLMQHQNDNDIKDSNIQALEEQIECLQNAFTEKNQKLQEMEKHNNFLLSRDMQIESTVQKLKAKYKQKINDKDREIDAYRVNHLQLQQKYQQQYEELEGLQAQMNQLNHHSQSQGAPDVDSFGNKQLSHQYQQSLLLTQVDVDNLNQQLFCNQQQSERSRKSESQTSEHEDHNKIRSKYEIQFGKEQEVGSNQSHRGHEELKDESSKPTSKHASSQNISERQPMILQQQPQAPISMHMNMDLAPVTNELEKLRSFISQLVEKSEQKRDESYYQSKRSPKMESSNDKLQTDLISQRDQQLKILKEFKEVLNHENKEIKAKFQAQCNRVSSLQKSNDDLKLENAKVTQKMHRIQNDMLNLQITNQDLVQNTHQDGIKKLALAQERLKELEDQVLKESLKRHKLALEHQKAAIEANSEYNRSLAELRAALGFVFGRVGMQDKDVPKEIQLVDQIAHIQVASKELAVALCLFDQKMRDTKIHSQTESHRHQQQQNQQVAQLKPLQLENKELVKLLQHEQKFRRDLLNQLQELKGNIRVVCRVRPILTHEKRYQSSSFEWIGANKLQTQSYLSNQRKTFCFDKVFKPNSKQGDVFGEVQNLIESSMEGYNVCVLAYGQTGSGKTFTMVGDDRSPGLYFSSVDELYRLVKKRRGQVEYDISVSVVEVYNEQMRDLLSKDQAYNQFKLLEGQDGNLYGDQIKRKVSSKNHILKALRDACHNRTVGITQFNEYSSRSHFVMTIFITGYDQVSKQVYKGKLTLVDLAGSERILRTNAEGIRKIEAQNINKSLATLGKVILNLQSKSIHIPYRDSKLTHYLKDSLGGNAKTMMIIHVSPMQKDHSESLSTLSFGQRTQNIEKGSLRAAVNQDVERGHRKSASMRSFKKLMVSNKPSLLQRRSESVCSRLSANCQSSITKRERNGRTALGSRANSKARKNSLHAGLRSLSNSMMNIKRSQSRKKLTNLPNSKTKSKSKQKDKQSLQKNLSQSLLNCNSNRQLQTLSKQQSRNLYDQILNHEKSQRHLQNEADDPLMDKDVLNDKFGQSFQQNIQQYQSHYVIKNDLEKYEDHVPNWYQSESPSVYCSTSQFANTDNTDKQYFKNNRSPSPASQNPDLQSRVLAPEMRREHRLNLKNSQLGDQAQIIDSLCQSQPQSHFQSTGRKYSERRQSQREGPESGEDRPLRIYMGANALQHGSASGQDKLQPRKTKIAPEAPAKKQYNRFEQERSSITKQALSNAQPVAPDASATIFESNLKEKSHRHKNDRNHHEKKRRSEKQEIEKSMLQELKHVNQLIHDIDAKIETTNQQKQSQSYNDSIRKRY